MKCLQKYNWVKLPRNALPTGKGLMCAWMRLASRAAFRKGVASYCGYENAVEPGMWAGGVVGLKSILGVRRRTKALETLDKLAQSGYLTYELDRETKKLTYQITDWVVKCSGKECMNGAVYTTDGYGFLCLPRNITERLAQQHHKFKETDAWLDLWCHTVWEDSDNGFSFLAPTIQYGKYGANLTLETLGQRWGWEKTKVWRFLKKHGDAFSLYRLPGSYIVLIVSLPSIVSNGIFGLDGVQPADDATLLATYNEMAGVVDDAVDDGYNQALAEVESIITSGGYDYRLSMDALSNYAHASAGYDVCYILAAYSASLEQKDTSKTDLIAKLNSVADSMFPVTKDGEGTVQQEVQATSAPSPLEHWCEYLIEQYKFQETKWEKSEKERKQALKRQGRENEISQRSVSEIFSDDINEIISLILLFYQNVPTDLFREFIQPYQEYITKSKLFLDQETFTVENLWDETAVFRWEGKLLIAHTDKERKSESAEEERKVLYMKDSTIQKLPHR